MDLGSSSMLLESVKMQGYGFGFLTDVIDSAMSRDSL